MAVKPKEDSLEVLKKMVEEAKKDPEKLKALNKSFAAFARRGYKKR